MKGASATFAKRRAISVLPPTPHNNNTNNVRGSVIMIVMVIGTVTVICTSRGSNHENILRHDFLLQRFTESMSTPAVPYQIQNDRDREEVNSRQPYFPPALSVP